MVENIVGDGGGAFPCEECMEAGMSLRDYFAAKALQALIAKAPMLYCPFRGYDEIMAALRAADV